METSTQSSIPNTALDFGNFDPTEIQVDETINCVFAIDVSGSVHGYVNELNQGINEFVAHMQSSHVADQLMVSFVTFGSDIKVKSGFQPIKNIPVMDFGPDISGLTALYGGVQLALTNALDYRENLENSGVNCKTLIFTITDGGNNASPNSVAGDVKQQIKDLLKEERNYASFTSILFGIGKSDGMEADFTQAKEDLGIEHLASIDDTAKDIRRMIAFISASISSVSQGAGVSAPNF